MLFVRHRFTLFRTRDEFILTTFYNSKASRMVENINTCDINMSIDELADIERILGEYPVSGGRYFEAAAHALHLWG